MSALPCRIPWWRLNIGMSAVSKCHTEHGLQDHSKAVYDNSGTTVTVELCETVMNKQCTTNFDELCETLHEKECEQCSTTSMEGCHIEYDTVVEIVPSRECKHVQEEVCTRISLQLVAAPVLPVGSAKLS